MNGRKTTTLAFPMTERPALDILAEAFRKEMHLITVPSIIDTLVYAERECLKKRGIDFLPAPDGADLIPVV